MISRFGYISDRFNFATPAAGKVVNGGALTANEYVVFAENTLFGSNRDEQIFKKPFLCSGEVLVWLRMQTRRKERQDVEV